MVSDAAARTDGDGQRPIASESRPVGYILLPGGYVPPPLSEHGGWRGHAAVTLLLILYLSI